MCNTRRFFRSGTAQYSNAHELLHTSAPPGNVIAVANKGGKSNICGLWSVCGIELAGRRKVTGVRWAGPSRPLANNSRQRHRFEPVNLRCRIRISSPLVLTVVAASRDALLNKAWSPFCRPRPFPKLYILIGAGIRELQPALLSSGMLEPHVDHPTRLPVHSFLAVSVGFSVRARKRRAQVTPESPPTTKH